METLNSDILSNFNLQNSLNRIVDIVNFEGPLLTLYENINNRHLYLIDWVDRDSTSNRWLIYRCNPKMLIKFIDEEISHRELFISDETYCYVIDIDSNFKWHNPQKIAKIQLPEGYIPLNNTYFEKCDCPNYDKLCSFINNVRLSQKQENLVVSDSLITGIIVNTKKFNTFKKRNISNRIIVFSYFKNAQKHFNSNSFYENNYHKNSSIGKFETSNFINTYENHVSANH
jgi:hypothetical protein